MVKQLMNKLMESVGIDVDKKETKLVTGKPIKNKSTFKILSSVIQADLLYLPSDNEYQFVLTVVDVATRDVDAEALTGRTAQHVIDGFERIFKRKYIKPENIQYIYTDQGAEFKNDEFHDYMKEYDIVTRHTMTNRKEQTGVVEYYNHLISKVLQTKMSSDEIAEHYRTNEWKKHLPSLIKAINENKKEPQKIKEFFKDPIIEKKEDFLKEGDIVHVRLTQPKDYETGRRLHGGFRNGDQRFEEQTRKIERVVIYPSQPVRYLVTGIKNASFLRSELLAVNEYKEVQQLQQPQSEPPKNNKNVKIKENELESKESNIKKNVNALKSKVKNNYEYFNEEKNKKYPHMVTN